LPCCIHSNCSFFYYLILNFWSNFIVHTFVR
jgi:hypothetical protein